ncbi:MAG: hypothetical protein COA90_03765 [Gammaproteobacteria bacterium]|nr:MAG: hypothetical protein COA90_03765 [Gammaproteobacteria bacterium]
MKLKQLSILLAASTLLATSSAMAWESEDGAHSTSASVALSTDYMWRGYSQTDNEFAISGSFDYAHSSGFYAGTWASNVDFALQGDDGNNEQAHVEVDVYAGFGGDIGDSGFSYDLGFLRYIYPSTADGNGDWNEYYASLSYSFVTAFVGYSDEYLGDDDIDATYYNLSASYDLPADFALAAGIGYYDIDGSNAEYADWSIGISKEFAGFGFDLSYTDTDQDNDYLADGRAIFTISKSM